MKSIRKEVIIEAPVSEVWKFLTEPDKLSAWLMDNDFQLKVGAMFTFRCEPREDWDGVIYCEVKEIIPMQKIVWNWTSDDLAIETLVTITLETSGEKTKVVLIHSGWDKLPPDKDSLFDNYDSGWEGYVMKNLKEAIE